ncbi:AbgT family transporter, partial [Staphylococcus haemolyticus]|uniref:AbgT family transporter n=1 Tax=Staphylococcus haemolyticus TaxID=1283 RepID=UPI002795C8A1
MSAEIIDPAYAANMTIAMNYYFIAASVLVLTFVGAWVTERIVEPRLGEYQGKHTETMDKLTRAEIKGIVWAFVAALVASVLFALLVLLPGAPLRGVEGEMPIDKSPFMKDGLVPILAILFLVPGIVYGMVTKTIRSDKDVAKMMADTMSSMGMFIVLSFVIAQFV